MRQARLPILLVLLALALYLPGWCPVVTWSHYGADGPELETAGRVLGVPHPTGYPLLMLLVRAVSILAPPPLSALNLVTLASAILAVAMAGVAGRGMARRVWREGAWAEAAGLLAGALFASSLTWWKQAVIGEVYPLHMAFVASVLALLFIGGARPALLAAWILGLGLGHHLQILPFTLVVAAYWMAARRGRPPRAAALGLLAPVLLYGGMLLRARHDPYYNWGNPDSLAGLWWSLSGAPYHGNLFNGGLAPFLAKLTDALLRGPVVQLGWGGTALALLGLAVAARRARPEALALLLLFGGASAVAAAYAIPDPAAYYLPASLAAALFAGLGGVALARFAWRSRVSWRPLRLALPAAAAAFTMACLIAQIASVAPQADASEDRAAYLYARDGMRALAPGALVLSHGDGRTFSLCYGAAVLSPRPDIVVIHDSLLNWPWYRAQVARRHPELVLPPAGRTLPVARAILIERYLDRRPVYVTDLEPELAALFTAAPAGPLYRVARQPHREAASSGASALPAGVTGGASSERTDRAALLPPGSARRSP